MIDIGATTNYSCLQVQKIQYAVYQWEDSTTNHCHPQGFSSVDPARHSGVLSIPKNYIPKALRGSSDMGIHGSRRPDVTGIFRPWIVAPGEADCER